MSSDPTDIRILDKSAPHSPQLQDVPAICVRSDVHGWQSLKVFRMPGRSRIVVWNTHRPEAAQVVGQAFRGTPWQTKELVARGHTTASPASVGATRTNPIVASSCSSCPLPCLSRGDPGGWQVPAGSGMDKLAQDLLWLAGLSGTSEASCTMLEASQTN